LISNIDNPPSLYFLFNKLTFLAFGALVLVNLKSKSSNIVAIKLFHFSICLPLIKANPSSASFIDCLKNLVDSSTASSHTLVIHLLVANSHEVSPVSFKNLASCHEVNLLALVDIAAAFSGANHSNLILSLIHLVLVTTFSVIGLITSFQNFVLCLITCFQVCLTTNQAHIASKTQIPITHKFSNSCCTGSGIISNTSLAVYHIPLADVPIACDKSLPVTISNCLKTSCLKGSSITSGVNAEAICHVVSIASQIPASTNQLKA
jgi:hypothetical protein